MGLPIATTKGGICFAFPDMCKTPVGTSEVPIPYPNIGQLSEADEETISTNVKIAGHKVILKTSIINQTRGDEAGTNKGVKSGTVSGKVIFKTASGSVRINNEYVVRMTDKTYQNTNDDDVGNAMGTVLGGVTNVRCG